MRILSSGRQRAAGHCQYLLYLNILLQRKKAEMTKIFAVCSAATLHPRLRVRQGGGDDLLGMPVTQAVIAGLPLSCGGHGAASFCAR
jgi:hypothetical protein